MSHHHRSHRGAVRASKESSGLGGNGRVPTNESDTTPEQLYGWMYQCTTSGIVHLEFLQTNPVADPALAGRGLRKNHLALRFELAQGFSYQKDGRQRICASIRASIEFDNDDTLVCSQVTLKPMSNLSQPSTSAALSYQFRIRQPTTIADLVRFSDCLRPFTYVIGAGSEGTRTERRRGRTVEVPIWNEHANGCRDFTCQWFIQLYFNHIVEWATADTQHMLANWQVKKYWEG